MKADLAPYVRSFFEDHLSCRRNVSYNTIQSYRDSLKLLLQYASRVINKCPTRLQVPDISPEMILDFLTDLERSRRIQYKRETIAWSPYAHSSSTSLATTLGFLTTHKRSRRFRVNAGRSFRRFNIWKRTRLLPCSRGYAQTRRCIVGITACSYTCTTPAPESRKLLIRLSAG